MGNQESIRTVVRHPQPELMRRRRPERPCSIGRGELRVSIGSHPASKAGEARRYFLAATGSTATATACVYTASIWSPTLISLSCAGSST